MPDKKLKAMASEVNSGTEMAKAQARSLIPDVDERFKTTAAIYKSLMTRLDAMAVSGEVLALAQTSPNSF